MTHPNITPAQERILRTASARRNLTRGTLEDIAALEHHGYVYDLTGHTGTRRPRDWALTDSGEARALSVATHAQPAHPNRTLRTDQLALPATVYPASATEQWPLTITNLTPVYGDKFHAEGVWQAGPRTGQYWQEFCSARKTWVGAT